MTTSENQIYFFNLKFDFMSLYKVYTWHWINPKTTKRNTYFEND